MKCLLKYRWVKLPRAHLPAGKGVMGYWARLASKAAFRKGQANYCGYINEVNVGTWSGGVVGLKSILGIKSRTKALEIMDALTRLGYIEYTLDPKTKKLLVRMISRNQRAVDEATTWLKRIVITWVILNTLGFIIAYLQPWFAGGQYTP